MNRLLIVVLSLLVVGVLFVFVYILYGIGQQIARPPTPPIHYTQGEYTPARPIYAPGETMVYSPTLIVGTAGRIEVLRSFWDRDRDANAVLCSGASAPTIAIARNFPPSTVGNVRGGSRVQVVVPPLPPGRYWLISSATGANGGQGVYQVAFAIEKPC